MRALDRKLLRDFWEMRGMALAIALVLVGGLSTFVMSLSTYDSLTLTQRSYYREQRFAEVFASLKRAPESLAERIREIPGVDKVETRVVAAVNIEVAGFDEPVTGTLVSIPDGGEPLLNVLYLRSGRLIQPGRNDEVLVSETFAEAHKLGPGDALTVVINGRRKHLHIAGVALSPEYIYQLPPGGVFPDFKRYGVLWMGHTPLAAAYDMDGAFNDVVLTLAAGTAREDVIDRLDALLEPYGGRGAYGRAHQLSHRFLSEELRGLRTMAVVFPTIFLGVAAFLLNVVVNRLINTQREQIAILKAFGYSNLDVGVHYTKLMLLIVALGLAGGLALGVWLGRGMSAVYTEFYRFPFLRYRLEPAVIVLAALVSVVAGLTGTLVSVRRAARLPPAQAMRPETPPVYRATIIERLGLQRWLAQPSRMIARHIERRPVKSLLTIAGIASACSIVMVSNFQQGSVQYMIDIQYGMSQRQDLAVTFTEPTSYHALYSLLGLQGVQRAEGYRAVPAQLRFEHRSYRTSIEGVQPDGQLYRVLDDRLRRIDLPSAGVVLTDYLGELLEVHPGDVLTVEVLEGARPILRVPVVGLAKQWIGVSAFMQRSALNRLMGEGDAISGAYLAIDSRYRDQIYTKLKAMPRVAGTVVREAAIQSFYQTVEETILYFTLIAAMLGAVIAFGVVYNSARIALSERSRELASLRVLGFSHAEISYILLGELALLTLAALPLGGLFGWSLCAYLSIQFRSDLYRIPLVVYPDTYAFAAAIVLGSACVSGVLMWRKLKHLDLIGVLKTRE